MSDFYMARLDARYCYTDAEDNSQDCQLVRPHWLLLSPPERRWEHQTAQHNLIARDYGQDVPTGNARLNLTLTPTLRAPTTAQLERRLRLLELTLNLHRSGTLQLREAWEGDAPLLTTRWRCVVSRCDVRPLPAEEAPPLPGAWGAAEMELILSGDGEVDICCDTSVARRSRAIISKS